MPSARFRFQGPLTGASQVIPGSATVGTLLRGRENERKRVKTKCLAVRADVQGRWESGVSQSCGEARGGRRPSKVDKAVGPGRGQCMARGRSRCRGPGSQALPLQPLPPSPSPRPPRMLSDWPSAYTKAVSISVWPRSRKARTAAALLGTSMRRPISMAPKTVAGRVGTPRGYDCGWAMARGWATQPPQSRTHPRTTS